MSFIIWMSGLPCSGKSTIARKLREHLPDLEILDGDELYKWLKPDSWLRESRITKCTQDTLHTQLPNQFQQVWELYRILRMQPEQQQSQSLPNNQ